MDSPIADPPFSLPFSTSVAVQVGWVCVHSFWQGLLVAAILNVALRLIPRRSTAEVNARYLLSVAALAALPLLAAVTFFATQPGPITTRPAGLTSPASTSIERNDSASTVPRDATDGALAVGADAIRGQLDRIEPWLPLVTLVWCVGVFLSALRMVAGWALTRRLVARAKAATETRWQACVSRWCESLGVKKAVRFLVSDAIDSPVVVGWLKPAILWPAAALCGMTPQDVEAIIAHELAHIRRGDVVVNLVQACIEVLFFHHPAAWWISAQIRAEREHCADDLAVRMLHASDSGTPLSYARALLALEEHRSIPKLSVAASGGSLLDRIRRLAGVETTGHSPARPIVGGLVTTTLLGILVAGIIATKPVRATASRPVMTQPLEATKPDLITDTTPAQSTADLPVDPDIEATLIAEAIINRLTNAGVPANPLRVLRGELWGAIEAGKPLSLQQVHARLEKLGIPWQTLHAPPAGMSVDAKANATQAIVDPNIISEPIAMAVTARLANAGVEPPILTKIHHVMWDAIRAGKPLSLDQLHARLEALGVPAETLHERPSQIPAGPPGGESSPQTESPKPSQPHRGMQTKVTEGFADSLLARVSGLGVSANEIETIRQEIRDSISKGTPLDFEQLRARLLESEIVWDPVTSRLGKLAPSTDE